MCVAVRMVFDDKEDHYSQLETFLKKVPDLSTAAKSYCSSGDHVIIYPSGQH
jgi:hypothetical protein